MIPNICVSLKSANITETSLLAKKAEEMGASLIEFRLDYLVEEKPAMCIATFVLMVVFFMFTINIEDETSKIIIIIANFLCSLMFAIISFFVSWLIIYSVVNFTIFLNKLKDELIFW